MSMFTERLRNDRNPFDNWDIREQAADKIEKLEERVEALKAALREIADLIDSEAGEPLDDAIEIAGAALAPEQDK
jgi:hypothetical protein